MLEENTNAFLASVKIFQEVAIDYSFSKALQWNTTTMNLMLICRHSFSTVK